MTREPEFPPNKNHISEDKFRGYFKILHPKETKALPHEVFIFSHQDDENVYFVKVRGVRNENGEITSTNPSFDQDKTVAISKKVIASDRSGFLELIASVKGKAIADIVKMNRSPYDFQVKDPSEELWRGISDAINSRSIDDFTKHIKSEQFIFNDPDSKDSLKKRIIRRLSSEAAQVRADKKAYKFYQDAIALYESLDS